VSIWKRQFYLTPARWRRSPTVSRDRRHYGLGIVLFLEAAGAATLVVVGIYEIFTARHLLSQDELVSVNTSLAYGFHWVRAIEFLLPGVLLTWLTVWAGAALVSSRHRGAPLLGKGRVVVVAACCAQPVLLAASVAWGRLSSGRAYFQPPSAQWFLFVYPNWIAALLVLDVALLLVGTVWAIVAMARRRIPWDTRWVVASSVLLAALWWLPINATNAAAWGNTFAFWSGRRVATGWSDFGVGVSCTPGGSCLAIAGQGPGTSLGYTLPWSSAVYRDGTWRLGAVLDGSPSLADELEPDSVSCASATTCLAVGRALGLPERTVLWRTTNAGRSWSSVKLLASAAAINTPEVRCLGSRCFIIDASVLLESDDAGRTWRVVLSLPLPTTVAGASDTPAIASVGCSSAATCLAVGGAGSAATVFGSHDGGRSWTAEPAPPGFGLLGDVRCTGRICHAFGSTIAKTSQSGFSHLAISTVHLLETTDNGAKWRDLGKLPGIAGPTGLACAPSGWCAAVGERSSVLGLPSAGVALFTTDNGSSWDVSNGFPTADMAVDGLSCSSEAVCVVIGSTARGAVLVTSSDGGRRWHEERYPRIPT
jgi:hypothetical protein